MSDFLSDIQDGMDEAADLCGDSFTIGTKTDLGDWTGADESIKLEVDGGAHVYLKGTLVLSRRRFPDQPTIGMKITDAAGTVYRVHSRWEDAASWILTLSSPNARR